MPFFLLGLSQNNELFLSDTNENHYLTVEELTIWLEKIEQIERAKYAWKRLKSLKKTIEKKNSKALKAIPS